MEKIENPVMTSLHQQYENLFLEHEGLRRIDDVINAVESSPSKTLPQESHKLFWKGQTAFLDIAALLPRLPKETAQKTANALKSCYEANRKFAIKNNIEDHKCYTTFEHFNKIIKFCQ